MKQYPVQIMNLNDLIRFLKYVYSNRLRCADCLRLRVQLAQLLWERISRGHGLYRG